MRNIRKFETYDEFLAAQESVSGSGAYVEDVVPGFAYIKELYMAGKECTFYNKKAEPVPGEGYVFGDIIYYVEGQEKLQKCYWSAFTPDMGEKVGLIVVPSNLAPDGNARMIPFGFVSEEYTPDPGPKGNETRGGDNDTSYAPIETGWTNNLFDENQTFFNTVPAFPLNSTDENDGGNGGDGGSVIKAAVPGSEGEETNYQYGIPIMEAMYSSDVHNDDPQAVPNPYTDGESYEYSNGDAAISPFLGDSLDRQDPAYLYPTLAGGSIGPEPARGNGDELIGGSNYNAFSDFSGYTWTYGCPPEYTAPIYNSTNPGDGNVLKSNNPVEPVLDAYFPHNYARMFSTDGTEEGDWYLPSMGEMMFVAARFNMILNTIMLHLFDEGALDNLDTLSPGTTANFVAFTSTVATYDGGSPKAANILGASVDGNNTSPQSYPVVMEKETLIGNEGGRVSFYPDTSNSSAYVLPFAMIKDGEIQHSMGDYTEANGHQIKDIYNGGVA